MRKKSVFKTIVLSALAALAITAQISTAQAQGTAFTYQGRLDLNSNLAQGTYDFTFALFDASTAGNQQGTLLTDTAIAVTNGLFVVTLDFGNQFPSDARWLEISVRTNGATTFTTLTPRQPLTPTPYSIFAENANTLTGNLPATQLTGTISTDNLPPNPNFTGTITATAFSGDGSQLTGVNALTLSGLATNSLWQLGGNSGANPANGAYLGTSDDLPLELHVGGARALRLEYAYNVGYHSIVPNLIGGYAGNSVSSGNVGATISGGGDAGYPNQVLASYATVVGGMNNTASGILSTAMGYDSTAQGYGSTVMGGFSLARGQYAIAMGSSCDSDGQYAMSLGFGCTALGIATIAMGQDTYASGDNSMAIGTSAVTSYKGSFVWADATGFGMLDTKPNQFLIKAAGGVGIGTGATPPGGLNVASGGLAVSGTSSPNYSGTAGVFIENETTFGAIFAFNYGNNTTLPLCLNTPGGDVGIGTSTPSHTLEVNGICAATSFLNTSDRNAKENFQPVRAAEILDKVAALPVTRWNFKTNDPSQHIGPMAQDFYAAFNVGPDDKHIATVDEDGVALAAIQGLNQKLEGVNEKLEADAKSKDAEITALKTQLAELRNLVKNLAAKNPNY